MDRKRHNRGIPPAEGSSILATMPLNEAARRRRTNWHTREEERAHARERQKQQSPTFNVPGLPEVTLASMGKISDWLANKNRAADDDILSKGVLWNAKGEMVSCVFCDYAQHRKENEILFEDDLVAAFGPLKPAAKQHILVIPKKHISTVGDLAPEDRAVLERMRQVAEQLLKCDPANMQFSFHIPPWNNIGELVLQLESGAISKTLKGKQLM